MQADAGDAPARIVGEQRIECSGLVRAVKAPGPK
jgi:hypothetical protein